MSIENPEVNKNIDILPEEQNLQTEDHQGEVLSEKNDDTDIESTTERIKKYELLLGSDEAREIRNRIRWSYFPIRKMLEPVLSSIKNGEYQLIIGEDASGRIPTLIVRRFVNKIYESIGLPDIKTNFLAGSRSKYFDNASDYKYKSSEKRAAYIKHLKDTSKLDINKALLVTEYIESGSSVANIIQALDKNNIKIDLLTVANESGVPERIGKKFKEKFSSFIALHSGDGPGSGGG